MNRWEMERNGQTSVHAADLRRSIQRGQFTLLRYSEARDEQPRDTQATQMPGLQRRHSASALGLAGLAAFALMGTLVQMRLFSGLDNAVARSMAHVGSPVLDWWASIAGSLASAEFAIAYAVLLGIVLWRIGAGWWAISPFAFLVPTGLELALKTWLYQPPIPASLHFHVAASSDLPTVILRGSFPSGHSLRSAFFCTFLAILFWNRERPSSRLLAIAILTIAPAVGLAMLYASWHWTSDVVAGLVLGASVALIITPFVARRLKSHEPLRQLTRSLP